jgi:hypothetical protein
MVKLLISNHAKHRLTERFRLKREQMKDFVERNLQDAAIYTQEGNNKLIVGKLCVLGICCKVANLWIITTVMDSIPNYYITSKPMDLKTKLEVVD